jgi:hypothetical protein
MPSILRIVKHDAALSLLVLSVTTEYSIMYGQGNQDALKLKGVHRFLVCVIITGSIKRVKFLEKFINPSTRALLPTINCS